MARIPYFDPADATGRAADLYSKVPHLNVFRMLGHGGELLSNFMALGNHLLAGSKLDPVLREIAIIRVGVLSKAKYEIQQHESIGRKLGMEDALLAAIHSGPEDSAFDDMQQLVMAFTDDIVANVRASDATFEPLRAKFSLCELEELIITIGYYMMVCRFLETLDVDLEEDPDGKAVKLPGMNN